ncbi:MAG TPA: restriction endonuclease subunit S [Polyangiales bacterium]
MDLDPRDYKTTEIGSVPREWDVKTVREFASIRTGPFGTLLKADEYSGREGVPLISVGEIGLGAFRISEDTPLVPDVVVRRLPQYVLRAGDVVFGRKGAVDRSVLVRPAQEGWFLGSDGISVRPSAGCHAPYLAFQFQSPRVQRWLLQNATGTTMASLNQEVLGRVAIPIATQSEQRAIAAALSDADALLGALDRLIAKKRDLKQAAMQQLLTGQTRLPGFSGEWGVKRLGDLAVLSKLGVDPGAYPEKTFSHFSLPAFDAGAEPVVERGRAIGSNKFAVPACAVLVSKLNPRIPRIWSPATIPENALCSTEFLVLIPKDSTDRDFLASLCRSPAVCEQMREQAIGTTGSHQRIQPQQVLGILSRVPADLVEQSAIAGVLSDMDAELIALEQRRDKTKLLKQGMMQELLTGRTRLV